MENPKLVVTVKRLSRDGYGLCVVGQPRHDQERLLWAWEYCNWQHFCVTNKKIHANPTNQHTSIRRLHDLYVIYVRVIYS